MSHLTLTTMTNFIKYLTRFLTPLFVAFALLSLAACDGPTKTIILPAPPTQQGEGGNAGANSTTPASQNITISYDLPEGWKWRDKEAGMSEWDHQSHDGVLPLVKLSACPFKKGSNGDLKNEVQNLVAQKSQECSSRGNECIAQPEYKEMVIAGIPVSMQTSKDYNNMGSISWTTTLEFEKDGFVSCFVLNDKGDEYLSELTTVIKSLNIQVR